MSLRRAAPASSSDSGRRPAPRVTFSGPAAAAARAAGVYLVVAALWILFSDRLLFERVPAGAVATVAMFKGWFFVGVTAVLLFWLLRRNLELRRRDAERLQLFVDHAPVAVAMLDRELRYVTASRRWCADYGLDGRDLRGRRHYEVFPDVPERWREIHRRALAGETLREEADPFGRADGNVLWLRWEVRPWLDAEGVIGGIVLFTEDISDRRRAELALSTSQSRLQLALECGHVGTWSWEIEPDKFDCDDACATLLGPARVDFVRGGVAFFIGCLHPADRAAGAAAIATARREGEGFNLSYRVVRPDGRVIWIADRGMVERDATGRALRLVGACVDVTEIKRMELALLESEKRFREVVETIREVFWISDVTQNRIHYVSPAFEEVWGRPCAELYASPEIWTDAIHEDDRERVREAASTRQAAGTYDETYRILRPDGSMRWIRDHAYTVRDEQGAVVRIIGTAEDITDRKKLEAQFLHAQRLEAIGTLASGVAHDLNNILAPMFMIAPLLRPKLNDPTDGELLTVVERSAQRGANIVRQLLTFSRGIGGERGPLQVRHLIKEMAAIMRETFPREIGIKHHVPAELAPVIGDATQLHQVLMNLCVNARDAMPGGGQLTIEARDARLGEEDVRGQGAALPGPYVVLTITDTGHGVPDEIRARIFEPFFTTKEIGKGTGLGLSTVLGIVKSHGGFVTLESQPGRGSSFRVHLPAATGQVATAAPCVAADVPAGRGEVVLVVDDEPAVRTSMRYVLERRGYRVVTAVNGREGLGVFLLHRETVRAVVTDLMMPEMGGVALVQALRELSPSLAILAATGLQDADKREALLALGVRELLPKPYAPAELLEALQRELQPPAPQAA